MFCLQGRNDEQLDTFLASGDTNVLDHPAPIAAARSSLQVEAEFQPPFRRFNPDPA
jgi:hypothetical protein